MIIFLRKWENWFVHAIANISMWTFREHLKPGKHESSVINIRKLPRVVAFRFGGWTGQRLTTPEKNGVMYDLLCTLPRFWKIRFYIFLFKGVIFAFQYQFSVEHSRLLVNPPSYCSFARHLAGKMIIRWSFSPSLSNNPGSRGDETRFNWVTQWLFDKRNHPVTAFPFGNMGSLRCLYIGSYRFCKC